MGITLAMDDLAEGLGIGEGVLVRNVDTDGPAGRAGMRSMKGGHLGDIIVGIDAAPVSSLETFFKALDTKTPGQEITVKVRRQVLADADTLDQVDLKIELGSRVL